MKVVCEGCSTKYSIGDDKVAGKVFKLRCKKCSRVIVLRGAALPAAPAVAAEPASATESSAVTAEPEWYAVRDGQQIGPFDSGELLRQRAARELADDSYVWREGFAEWQPLSAVGELRPSALPVAAQAAPLAPPAPQAGRLHGARNESSALFTLSNLARLATPAAASSAAAGAPGSGTEGSGLLEIRSLARGMAPAAPARGASASSRVGSMADLPVFPSAAFMEPAVLVPRAERRDRRLAVGLVASVGMLAICAALLAVVMVVRRGTPTVAAEPLPPPGPQTAAVEPPATPRTGALNVIEPPTGPTVPTPTPTPTPTPEAQPQPQPRAQPEPTPRAQPQPQPQPRTQPRVQPQPQPRTQPQPQPQPQPRTQPQPQPQQCDQVTCIVNGYDSDCCRALRGNPLTPPRTQPPGDSSQLPDSLDRPAISTGLGTISTKSCNGSAPAGALVKARVKVSPGGAVTSVTVESSPDPALSSCVSAQIQKGQFPKTQRGGSFAYVWRF